MESEISLGQRSHPPLLKLTSISKNGNPTNFFWPVLQFSSSTSSLSVNPLNTFLAHSPPPPISRSGPSNITRT